VGLHLRVKNCLARAKRVQKNRPHAPQQAKHNILMTGCL
jgi:hypothetical protein